jgi:beta-N-acetylhexosaminidase
VVDDEQVAALTAQLRAERDDVVVGIDEEGGDVTRLDVATGSFVPSPLALGAADDPELTAAVAASLGARLAACGITVNLAPSADLTLAPEDPIIGVRAFGSDPAAAAPHVAAYVTGMQQCGLAACAKHVPGHGAATEDSHVALPVLPRPPEELREIELVPFAAAIDAGVRAVMSGHLVVPAWGEAPATLNRVALTDVLRGELGFTGAVITDALDMAAVSGGTYGDHSGIGEAGVRALLAGADALCIGGAAFDVSSLDRIAETIAAAVEAGRLPLARLADAAARTAALSAAPTAGPVRPPDRELGLRAARAALRVTGTPRLAGPPLVVDVTTDPTIAAGPMPWGLGPHLTELLPGAEARKATPEAAAALVAGAGGRPVVLVTRDAHRHPAVRELLAGLSTVDYLRVETGVPGGAPGDGPRLDTFSGSWASLRAAAEYLAGK